MYVVVMGTRCQFFQSLHGLPFIKCPNAPPPPPGASRVLKIRNAPQSLTDERLRLDLDHIANLHVEKTFRTNGGKDVQCNLNSVCVALFARTCLRSRAYYKVTQIEFGVDECATPLPDYHTQFAKGPRQKDSPKQPYANRYNALPAEDAPRQPHPNRFHSLFAEDGGEEHIDSEDEVVSISTFTPDHDEDDSSSLGAGSWADSTTTTTTTGNGGGAYLRDW